MRQTDPGRRRKDSFLGLLRELVTMDLFVARSAFSHLAPELQSLIAAPALLILGVLDRIAPPRSV